jgi:hypothetical protein
MIRDCNFGKTKISDNKYPGKTYQLVYLRKMEETNMKLKLARIFSLILISIAVTSAVYSQSIGLVNVKRAEQVITVGGPEADVPGFTSGSIQIALDAIRSRGGGVVKLNPGVYKIIGPVRVPDNTSLTGSGKVTILQKCEGFKTSFIIDADWGMLKAVVKDVSGFKIGMGIQLYDDKHNQGWDVTTAVITDIQDNVIYFDNNTVNDYISSSNGTVSNGCSVIEAVGVENVKKSSKITAKDNKISGSKEIVYEK